MFDANWLEDLELDWIREIYPEGNIREKRFLELVNNKEKSKMRKNVKFVGSNGKQRLYFSDLEVGEDFRIASTAARGAVYTKIKINGTSDYYMLEIATGIAFKPSSSPVEYVETETTIKSDTYTPGNNW